MKKIIFLYFLIGLAYAEAPVSIPNMEAPKVFIKESKDSLEMSIENNGQIIDGDIDQVGQDIPPLQAIDPFMMSIAGGNLQAFIEILNSGGDVNKEIFDNQSVLHVAAWQNKYDFFSTAISYDANIFKKNAKGELPMHWAAYSNDLKYVELLFADIKGKKNESELIKKMLNSKNKLGQTPLHFALLVYKDKINIKMLGFLVSKGANVNEPDNAGLTPVHYAAVAGNLDVLEYFLNNNGDFLYTSKEVVDSINPYNLFLEKSFNVFDGIPILNKIEKKFFGKILTRFEPSSGISRLPAK